MNTTSKLPARPTRASHAAREPRRLAALAIFATACGGAEPRADRDRTAAPERAAQTAPADASTPVAPCNARTPESIASCVDQARYAADLNQLAAPRPPGSPGWQRAQDLCAERLAALGFEVERHDYGTGINVVGRRAGVGQASADVILSAHYDGVPECPGADDNATGVAGVLEAARALSAARFEHTLVVACWDQEELGLIGSWHYAKRAAARGDRIAAAIVFEMIGYASDAPGSQTAAAGLNLVFPAQHGVLAANEFRGDFLAVVADERASEVSARIARAGEQLGLPVVVLPLTVAQTASPLMRDLRRSDHDSFWQHGYPALMLTDTANFRNHRYHCYRGIDDVEPLDHAFATSVIRAAVTAAADALVLRPPGP